MKQQTYARTPKKEQTNPLLNAAIIAAVSLAILPVAIFGAARCFQSQDDAPAEMDEAEEAAPKRSSVAERRAQRLEARKAKEAQAGEIHPVITMEKVDPYYDDFGMDFDADMEFDGFGMTPPPYMGGFGMTPPVYMGGPGMMPVPDRGGFNGWRTPGADRGFDRGFGGGRGSF